ncbi:hypothetical protein [Phycicoccus flavus]|uniref:hypothetical protein n=1 Tax=Phycicoccus flavus TaxID=2502783 RepID=UPI000FEBA7CE|nr:hypothetical protein [Phycicoccus flavus]NHA67959.1 hypothetical protein [Phycicoccus flavus]
MSSHRQPGRRRAPGRVRRFPDGFPRTGASWAVKSVASLGVVGGAAVALTIPAESADAEVDPSVQVTAGAQAAALTRGAPEAASRSEQRAPAAAAPAVSAPVDAAPRVPEPVGVEGVKAVAKPKPKPKPKPTPTPTPEPVEAAPAPQPVAPAAPAPQAAPPAAPGYNGALTGRCTSIGLITNAQRLCSAVDQAYGPPTIGGRRASADEHGTGQAIDFMISSAGQGDAIAAYVQSHVGEFNVKYLIWQQRYWAPGQGWKMMEDRGSTTANHYDHVHVTINF